MKTVLLTGATGFIGQFAVSHLLAKNYIVHAVTSKPPQFESSENLFWHQANLLDRNETASLIKSVSPTHLLHLAWYVEHGKHQTARENFAWVCASLALFENFAANGGQRAIFAGTCAEYLWMDETIYKEYQTPLKPATTYGKCKHALQILIEAYAQQFEISSAWGRVFFLYGPQDRTNRVVASVTRNLLQNKPALCSHGNQIRDFLYVEDAADALVALLDSDVRGSVNIASGIPVLLKEVILTIGDLTENENLVKLGAIEPYIGEPPQIVADTRRLNDEVGWYPRLALAEGLTRTVAWWRENIP